VKKVLLIGPAGSGKTTLARFVSERLRNNGVNPITVDGDTVRSIVGDGLTHTPDDRLANAMRIARICYWLSDQGQHVVCATMSCFVECQSWNREHITGYVEVFVNVPMHVLIQRDQKQFLIFYR